MPTYAPILLFTYNRPSHTRRLVESLLQNPESAESHLFIYSDAPRNEDARPAVDEVRRYIHSLNGFKQVDIVERTETGDWPATSSTAWPPSCGTSTASLSWKTTSSSRLPSCAS